MTQNRLHDFFQPPSAGDRLLAAATSAKLELRRWSPLAEPDGDNAAVECTFELTGSLPVAGGVAAGIVRDLLREFSAPRQPRRENGGDA